VGEPEREGLGSKDCLVTGNTVIDALMIIQNKWGIENYKEGESGSSNGTPQGKLGSPLEEICHAIKDLALEFTDYRFVFPVHLNPAVRKTVFGICKMWTTWNS